MQIAFYKSAHKRTFFQQLTHRAICLITNSNYSHTELIIDGLSYSSSPRDGGVRDKVIEYTTDRWDIFDVRGDEQYALLTFASHVGNKYDNKGVLRFVFPFLKQDPDKDFCSELNANMLGVTGDRISPQVLFELLKESNRIRA